MKKEWTDEELKTAKEYAETFVGPVVAGWREAFIEVVTELQAERKRNARPSPEELAKAETVWQPKLKCPTCKARLEPMELAPPENTGVCPACGELVRSFCVAFESGRGAPCPGCSTRVRTYLGARVYTDEEAEEQAHPEVLAKLRKIQAEIRSKQ